MRYNRLGKFSALAPRGGTKLTKWTIAAAALAVLCGFLTVGCVWLSRRLEHRRADAEALQREMSELRYGELRAQRENEALLRALEQEERYADDMERELDAMEARMADADRRAGEEEDRRIAAEKNVSAAQMKIALLERQIQSLEDEQLAQERLYQDILREREETIRRLQDGRSKRRMRKKPDILDRQISILDLLDVP